MLFARKGQFAENYVCPVCGMVVDPSIQYVKHENQLGSIISDENENMDDIIMVQPQQERRSPLAKDQRLNDAIDLEMKAEIERGGRKQLVSISTQSNEAFSASNTPASTTNFSKVDPKVNRIERPKRF